MSRESSTPARVARPRRADVRRRLLRAALSVFVERGYDRASLEQVAAAAGFTKGAVYSNFASKDELFVALMDEQIQVRLSQARQALADSPGTSLGARAIGDRLAVALAEDSEWQLLFLDYVQRAGRDPAVRERFTRHRKRVRQLVADTIREFVGAAEADSALDADELAVTVLALSNGLSIERFADPDAVPEQLLGRILQILQPLPEAP